ncbi:MAG: GlxA family transcriptional regulator [Thermoleophilaceae bacterium]
MAARRVLLVAFPDVQMLDVTGPSEVFSMADRLAGGGAYSLELATATGEPVTASSGLRLVPDRALDDSRGRIDTLIVAGGAGMPAALEDTTLVPWLRRATARSRRVASVCNGAFLLAAAGLLDGRRATTHWAACEELRRRHPQVTVDGDAIFVRDGDVSTSAGVTAGIDLALALVEEDLGPKIALDTARWLVLFVKRPGGQSQFSAQLAGELADRPPIRELQEWIPGHLDADLSVPALAERAHMSPRNFARAFSHEVGLTPAAYVEAVRLERARMALEGTAEPLDQIALRCGFGTPETMRRAFHRRLRVSPSEYRDRFCQRRGEHDGHRHPAV